MTLDADMARVLAEQRARTSVQDLQSGGPEGLLVQISPRGTVVDYLRMPTEYLNNWNHLIPIPRDLY